MNGREQVVAAARTGRAAAVEVVILEFHKKHRRSTPG